ncbi:signal-induced proliferation-associated 1-like protein 2 [Tubulanus polymorphus]|uniref:signal-induced proliferation-associated 1-like protein 2 n=1 Tax=Tubulanus polymorphus TaxID=672921 RepID=UPI003DA53A24
MSPPPRSPRTVQHVQWSQIHPKVANIVSSNLEGRRSQEDLTSSTESSAFLHQDNVESDHIDIKSKGSKQNKERSGTTIFKKLRSGGSNKSNDSRSDSRESEGSSKNADSIDSEYRLEEQLRRKAFVHYDTQSISVNFLDIIKKKNSLYKRRNTATGASAASGSSGDLQDENNLDESDDGDGKSNNLVLSCPFFRNEFGGEEDRVISLSHNSLQHKLSHSYVTKPICELCGRRSMCNGISILEVSPALNGYTGQSLTFHHGHIIEFVDQGVKYYRNFFVPYDHQNYVGVDEHLGPLAVSIRREKDSSSTQYRIIIRTSELSTLRGTILEDVIPSTSKLNSNRGLPAKDILEYICPDLQISCLRLAATDKKADEQLMKLDEQGLTTSYKVGVMYCKAGQSTEEEMYNNEYHSAVFDEFLEFIGEKVRLKGFDKYRAGLDNKTDSTGNHSVFTTFKDYEIMFHISTMLPYTPNNKQQLLRKRHIGNDIVTIVFQEPGSLPFTPKSIRSHFQHVFIVIQAINPNTTNVKYRVSVSRSKDVPLFGPSLPEGATFTKSKEFLHFLLAKIINGENAVHKSDRFVAMATRTRQEYLKDLAVNYSSTVTIEASSSKLGKFGLGSGRKRDKNRQKLVPDVNAHGAIVWQVQVENFSQSNQLDCFLALGEDVLLLIEEQSKNVVFTVPCKCILGWTINFNGLRLYYNHSECIAFKTRFNDGDEIQEIVQRLSILTQGCESSEMTLKRNNDGQLGFNIQQEGLVTDVELNGLAWQAGLRQNSRLVDICKVATATLTHDQMIDLLRTSMTVKVVVIPPLEDGSPRKGCEDPRHTILTAPDYTGSHGLHSLLVSRLEAVKMSPRSSPTPPSHMEISSKYTPSNSKTPSRQSMFKDYVDIQSLVNETSTIQKSSQKVSHENYADVNAMKSGLKDEHLQTIPTDDLPLSTKNSPRTPNGSKEKFPTSATEDMTDRYHERSNSRRRLNQGQNHDGDLDTPLPSYHRSKVRNMAVNQSTSSSNLSQLSDASSESSQPAPVLPKRDYPPETSQFALNKPVMSDREKERRQQQKYLSPQFKNVRPRRARSPGKDSPHHRHSTHGMSLHTNIKPTEALKERSFQEELMQLIGGDFNLDLNSTSNRGEFKSRLQRTLSDESICGSNSKLRNSPRSTPVKPNMTPPTVKARRDRLSPRATSGTPSMLKSRQSNSGSSPSLALPAPTPPPQDMEWSSLVDTATKVLDAVDVEEANGLSESPIEGNLQDQSVTERLSASSHRETSGKSKKILDLEKQILQLQAELMRERRARLTIQEEVDQLHKDNARLLEESQTAAAQLRKFTEWFFNTIDRH